MRGSGCEAAEWAQAGVRPGVENALRFEITSQSPGGPPCLLSSEPGPPALYPALPLGDFGRCREAGVGGQGVVSSLFLVALMPLHRLSPGARATALSQ